MGPSSRGYSRNDVVSRRFNFDIFKILHELRILSLMDNRLMHRPDSTRCDSRCDESATAAVDNTLNTLPLRRENLGIKTQKICSYQNCPVHPAANEEVAYGHDGHHCGRAQLGASGEPDALRLVLLYLPQARHICALAKVREWGRLVTGPG
jgi:hypothetical protein